MLRGNTKEETAYSCFHLKRTILLLFTNIKLIYVQFVSIFIFSGLLSSKDGFSVFNVGILQVYAYIYVQLLSTLKLKRLKQRIGCVAKLKVLQINRTKQSSKSVPWSVLEPQKRRSSSYLWKCHLPSQFIPKTSLFVWNMTFLVTLDDPN